MSRDWYPRSRDEQLMVDTWLQVFKTKATAWNIPPANVTSLITADTNAKNILAVVKSGERTAASMVECNEAFREMETEARFIKKHFLLIPPLTLADLPTLLLPLPDETHTPVPPPTGQPVLSITYSGGPPCADGSSCAPLRYGTAGQPGDYGYALYRGIMPQGGATLEQAASVKHYLMKEPLSGDELLHYRFTRQKKELVDFAASESGMTAYFCACYENQKRNVGTWGPVSAVIP